MRKLKPTVQAPSKVYSQCPKCKSHDLIRLAVDVVCAECDWDSTAEFVASGGMDNIFAAYLDHFEIDNCVPKESIQTNVVQDDLQAAEPAQETLDADAIFVEPVTA